MQIKPLVKFLGLNETIDGDTQIKFGEANDMVNFRVTDNYKLKQIEGYEQYLSSEAYPVVSQWHGYVNDVLMHVFVCNGKVFKKTSTTVQIGTITGNSAYMFGLNGILYIQDGTKYQKYDGTTFGDVVGYAPVIAKETLPAGGGTNYEQINLLTGQKWQWFSADGTSTTYYLRETGIDATLLTITINGVSKTEGTHFTVNRTLGTVNFAAGTTPHGAPIAGTDNVKIKWEKANSSARSEITSCKRSTKFGTRVHMFAGSNTNRRYYSGLEDISPVMSAEYFPALAFSECGDNELLITDIMSHNENYQVILTDKGKSFYSYYSMVNDIVTFPVSELSDTVGNVALGQSLTIADSVFSFQNGVHQWLVTSVETQRATKYISKRVQNSIDSIDLTSIITAHWEFKKEMWISSGKLVIVYNYQNDTWYKMLLNDTISSLIVIDDQMYFGTSNGKIMRFKDSLRNFNGVAIDALWEMGYYDFDVPYLRKFTSETFVPMQTDTKSNLNVYWQIDDGEVKEASQPIGYNLFDYSNIDYANWSYVTTSSPKPKMVRTKAKKFSYIKIILRNNKLNYRATVLGMDLTATIGGKVK